MLIHQAHAPVQRSTVWRPRSQPRETTPGQVKPYNQWLHEDSGLYRGDPNGVYDYDHAKWLYSLYVRTKIAEIQSEKANKQSNEDNAVDEIALTLNGHWKITPTNSDEIYVKIEGFQVITWRRQNEPDWKNKESVCPIDSSSVTQSGENVIVRWRTAPDVSISSADGQYIEEYVFVGKNQKDGTAWGQLNYCREYPNSPEQNTTSNCQAALVSCCCLNGFKGQLCG